MLPGTLFDISFLDIRHVSKISNVRRKKRCPRDRYRAIWLRFISPCRNVDKREYISPNDFGPVTIDSHRDNGARLARREGQFSKFRLFHADLVIAVQSASPEILAPVSILIVDHQQSEASVFTVRRASGGARHCRSQNRSALYTIILPILSDIATLPPPIALRSLHSNRIIPSRLITNVQQSEQFSLQVCTAIMTAKHL